MREKIIDFFILRRDNEWVKNYCLNVKLIYK